MAGPEAYQGVSSLSRMPLSSEGYQASSSDFHMIGSCKQGDLIFAVFPSRSRPVCFREPGKRNNLYVKVPDHFYYHFPLIKLTFLDYFQDSEHIKSDTDLVCTK